MSGALVWALTVCFHSNVAPLPLQVDRLVALLSSRKMGVVAHFYMDPEVCGQEGSEIRQGLPPKCSELTTYPAATLYYTPLPLPFRCKVC